ncbi:MAG: hypothetical protein K8R56_02150 [Candidatus Eisenbacteria bacterium]|nr:hypothetical protein [Candidatus Eisenbacteria bacterium]
MKPTRIALAMVLMAAMATSQARPARAELALASGAAWPGSVARAHATGSVGWRTGLSPAWSYEVRGSDAGMAFTLRAATPRQRAWSALRPAVGAGVDVVSAGHRALLHAPGFHVETSLAYALPEGSALELTARWVQRGERAPRGPEAFAPRYAEVTLGLVFSPR